MEVCAFKTTRDRQSWGAAHRLPQAPSGRASPGSPGLLCSQACLKADSPSPHICHSLLGDGRISPVLAPLSYFSAWPWH